MFKKLWQTWSPYFVILLLASVFSYVASQTIFEEYIDNQTQQE